MLSASDLLNLRVKDLVNKSGSVKSEVKVKMKKTGKTTLSIPLSKNSIHVIKKYLLMRNREDYVFRSSFSHFTKKPLSIFQYSRIVKKWCSDLGVESWMERWLETTRIENKNHTGNGISEDEIWNQFSDYNSDYTKEYGGIWDKKKFLG